MTINSDEEEFPTLDVIFNKMKSVELKSTKKTIFSVISTTSISSSVPLTKARPIENTPHKTDTISMTTPTSEEKHRALALDLFPPSPPSLFLSTSSNRARSTSPTSSIISDSEPDLPSSLARIGSNLESYLLGSSSRTARHSSVESLIGNFSEDDSNIGGVRGNVNDSLARSVFNLSEDEVEGRIGPILITEISMTPKAPKVSTSTPTPRKKPSTLNKRRIAISIASSDCNSDSDTSYTSNSPPPLRTIESTRKAKAAATFGIAAAMECICLTNSDEEDGEVEVITKKKKKKQVDLDQVEKTPTSEKSFSKDSDSNEGILTYEPTPRARKPIKLVGSTPLRTPSKSKIGRNIISIDLTTCSDSSGCEDSDVSFTPSIKTPSRLKSPIKSKSKSKSFVQPSLTLPTSNNTPKVKSKSITSTPQPKSKILTASERENLPIALIRELDKAVFRKEWEGMRIVGEEGIGLPDGMEINWNKRLLNTAGRATVKTLTTNGRQTHQTLVDLSVKVTDTESKLRHTLAHELCHVVAWVISKEMKPSHGPAFKLWAARVMKVRPDIKISTTHSYEISYKFRWQCISPDCAKIFQRHSNSINVESHGCSCGSKIIAIDKDGNVKIPKTTVKSAWQEFLTAMGPRVRLDNPGKNQGEITKIVSVKWREAKELAATQESSRVELAGQGLVSEMAALKVI